jgi:hypothetical protein
MVRRRSAALLLAFGLAGFVPAAAVAAIPTLKPTPPTSLTRPPRPHPHPRPVPTVTVPPATPTTSTAAAPTRTTTTATLPMTGSDLPLELGIAGALVAAGLLARLVGRTRRYRTRRY